MENLEGKNAVLTGASRGIGPRVARALAGEGVNLLLIGNSQAELNTLAADLNGSGVQVELVAAEISDRQQRRNIPKRARSTFDQIDILINNSATTDIGSFARQEEVSIQRMIETNVSAPMLITRDILPPMLERDMGHVVNVASLAGRLGMPYSAVYAGTEAALIEWSLSLNAELHETAVNVSVVCTGLVADEYKHQGDKPIVPPLRSVSPERAAQTVIKAIKKNRPDLILSAGTARPMLVLRAISPAAANWLDRKLGLPAYAGATAR